MTILFMFLGLLTLVVPRPLGLTALRCLGPAAFTLAIWAAGAAGVAPADVAALALTSAAAGLAFTPAVGDALVDGASYGPERRLALRPPVALLLGPVPLAWALLAAGAVTGPLLLAAEKWVPGGLALVVGLPVAAGAARALHGLARRWLVVLPGGVVVHDHMAVSDPVLVPRRSVAHVGPARPGSDAVDLTVGAAGLALELALSEPVELVQARRGREPANAVAASAVLVTPSLPSTAVEAITQGP